MSPTRRLTPVVLTVALAAAACGTPSGPSRTTVALQSPTLVSPVADRLIGDLEQPVTLVARNPLLPSGASVTAVFEVATDAAFGTIVAAKSVPAGPDQLSSTLDPLPAGRSYHWRVRIDGTGVPVVGATSATSTFRVGAAITSGPYRLTIMLPGREGCCPLPPLRVVPYEFDGELRRLDQSTIVFTQPNHPYTNTSDLYWGMHVRADGRLEGTANGSRSLGFSAGPRSPYSLIRIEITGTPTACCPGNLPIAPANVTGSLRPDDAVMIGELSAYVRGRDVYDQWFARVVPPINTFTWTLAPR